MLDESLRLGPSGQKDIVAVEGLRPEDWQRFVDVVSSFLEQGELLHYASDGNDGKMILFEGRGGEDFASMQVQGGGNLLQLIVDGIVGNEGYMLHINLWSNQNKTSQRSIRRFRKQQVDGKFKKRVDVNTRGTSIFHPKDSASLEDFIRFTEFLEKVSLDQEKLDVVVEDILRRGKYLRVQELPDDRERILLES